MDIVGLTRLELVTPTLSVWCSNQLSYRTSSVCFRNGHHLRPSPRFILATCQSLKGDFPFSTDLQVLESASRKEVFQPHLPVRLPCYDLAPVTSLTLGRSSRLRTSGTPGFHGLTGGVYKARERIHRTMADVRLLANPASWSRVPDSSPN